MILGSGGSKGNTSTALKRTSNDLACVTEADARSVEEMADSMLLDSPLPDTEEEERRQHEETLTGEPIMPSPPNLDFLPFVRFFTRRIFP